MCACSAPPCMYRSYENRFCRRRQAFPFRRALRASSRVPIDRARVYVETHAQRALRQPIRNKTGRFLTRGGEDVRARTRSDATQHANTAPSRRKKKSSPNVGSARFQHACPLVHRAFARVCTRSDARSRSRARVVILARAATRTPNATRSQCDGLIITSRAGRTTCWHAYRAQLGRTRKSPGRKSRASRCSPEQIRTAVTALRGRRPRPLDDGAALLRE